MKYVHVYVFFLMSVFHTFCGQSPINVPKDNIRSGTKDTVTSYGPNTMVRNVKQDRNGNILIAASWGGVFRYDGKSFTNVTGDLFPDRFFSVLEDRKGNFWFGNYGSGAYYYDGKSLRNFTTKEGLPNNWINSIMEDKTEKLWFGTSGNTCVYDEKTFTVFTNKDGKAFNNVWSIIEDKKGNIWLGGNKGL